MEPVTNSVEENSLPTCVNVDNSANCFLTDSLFKHCSVEPVDTNLVQSTNRVDTVCAITAAELRGPWFSATAGSVRFPCAADTFCPRNLISEDLAHQLGASVVSEEGRMFGVGDGSINIVGSTTFAVTIGRRTKSVEFKVTPELADFAFFGFAEQARWGFVIETTNQIISFAGESVPYFSNMADALRPAARLAPVIDDSAATKVFLEHSVVVPPSGGGEGFLTFGKARGPRLDGDVIFEPTQLKDRYGMMGPRITQRLDEEGRVSVVISNPFPVPIKIFRGAHIGHLFEAEVTESEEPKVMGPSEDTSPDDHPIDRIELEKDRGPGWTPARKAQVQEMLKRRYKAFSRGDHDIGHTTWQEFHIELKADCPGPQADAQRNYPRHKKEIIDKNVQELLEKGLIEHAQSAYRAFPVLSAKKDPVTREWIPDKRFAIDFRSLNRHTVKWSRLIPKIGEVIESMNGAKWFSSIDLIAGYHQIPVAPASRPLTAFCVPGGRQFQWRVMPFGLANAGACFSQLMETVLAGLSYKSALSYLDDIIVFSKTFEEHVADLETVLERLEIAGLKARSDKCHLFVREVEVLGHVVSEAGVRPDPMKTKAVEMWPVPENAKELVSFLAFCNFYRRFVRDFAHIAYPLNQLTHNDAKWEWGRAHQSAFDALKRALCSEPVMALPDFDKEFVISTDWSRKSIAWVLQQTQPDGRLHPILYGSRGLTRSERKYGSTRGEFLAMSEGILSCRHYLLGAKFTAQTDNKALCYLSNYRDLTHRTARALEALADYGDFKIQYIQGKRNVAADSLSRVDWKETSFSKVDKNEILAPVATRSSNRDAANATETTAAEPAGPRDWSKAQNGDDDVRQLKKWLRKSERPPLRDTSGFSRTLKSYWSGFEQFRLKDGIVHRVWSDEHGGEDRLLKVVPEEWKARLMSGFHDELGHPGISRTNATIRTKYYWHSMSLDIRRFIETCSVCQIVKPNRARAPLQQHPLSFFNQRVFWDVKGPLSVTRRGNEFYLVIVDGFSRWTEILPLRDIKASTVFQEFYQRWVCQHGTPVSLHSDKGSSLTGKLAKEVVDLLETQQTTTVSHHQMANGEAENRVKASMAIIAAILSAEDSLEWDLAAPKVAMAINTVVNSSTGQTPYLIKHSSAQEMLLPVDIAVGNLPDGKSVDVSVRGLRDTQRKIYAKVMEATGSSLRRQKRNYDRLVAGPEISVGDTVRYEEYRMTEIDKSFKPKYRNCLYNVTERLSDVNYRIEEINAEKPDKRIVHYNQLKRVEEPRPLNARPNRVIRRPGRFDDFDMSNDTPQVQ